MLFRSLKCYDRAGIDAGRKQEQVSTWTIQECDHIFLMAENIQVATDVYASKNHDLDKKHTKFQQRFLDEATRQNVFYNDRLTSLRKHLQDRNRNVYSYTIEHLFRDDGYLIIEDIKNNLDLNVPSEYVQELHSIWLNSTKELYYNLHDKSLDL